MKPTFAKFVAALALAGAGLAAPARAEVVATSDIGFISRNAVEVTVSPFEAWAAFTAPAKWWNASHSWSGDAAGFYMDPQAGGCFCELLPVADGAPEGTRRGSVEHMRVIFADPGRVMRLSGALGPLQGDAVTGTLTVTFKAVEGGTRIGWEYVVGGYMRMRTDQIGPGADRMLADQIGRLAAFLGPLIRAETPADEPAPADAPTAPEGDGGDEPAVEEGASDGAGTEAAAAEAVPPAEAAPSAEAGPPVGAAPQAETPTAAAEPAPARPRRLRRPLSDGPADPETAR